MRKLFVTLLLASATPSVAAVNLISNGGFETPAAPSGGYNQYFGGQTFGGWNVTGADVLVLDTTYNEFPPLFTAYEGNAALDITGAGNTSPANGVYQDINLAAGSYQLTFALGNATGSGIRTQYALPSSIGVAIGNGAVQNFTNANVLVDGTTWAVQTLRFTSAGGVTRIAFTNTTPAADSYAGLDAVSLNAVPEPATWGLMALGFGLIGASVRRRRGALAAA